MGSGIEKLIAAPPVKCVPAIDPELRTAILPGQLEENCVYVHCHCTSPDEDLLIRIWKTTVLVDKETHARIPLVHAENISIAPQWTLLRGGSTHHFLLIFQALPSTCKKFDLIEEIAQPGGFAVHNIVRNERDIYHVRLV